MKKILFLSLLMLMAVELSYGQITNVFTAQDSLIRPPNGTQYTANDVVNDSTTGWNRVLNFTNVVATKGFGGIITEAILTVGDSINTTNGSFTLLLFRDSVASAADNAAWATNTTMHPKVIGEINFVLGGNGTVMNYSIATGNLATFNCSSDKKNLYGVLIAKAAFTPAFRQKFIVTLRGIRN